ncbi:hypothetical protein HU200_003857 [Digitaria exilis]|uniref:PUM-HD domain-containing protein n=1 Tax=Digitaria exilis TaxID=1010633 RepID=A0A835FUG6_9POAL|nr:hypothetical protein HU200_003857 [Digitaria exilis]
MESTTAQNAAAHPKPTAAADLGAYFRVMRLGDDDSSPQAPQVPVPTTTADALMQQLHTAARHYFPHQQPQSYGVGGGETSTSAAAGYAPPPYPYASSRGGPRDFYASHFGMHSPRSHHAAAAPTRVTPELYADAAGHFDPISSSSSSTPSPNPSAAATHYQFMPSAAPRLGAAACFPQRDGGNSSILNPHASAFQSTIHAANPNQMGMGYYNQSWLPHIMPQQVRYYRTLEQVRSRLRRRPLEMDLLAFPQTVAHVVHLLDEGDDEQVRRSVLAGVRRDVRGVMESADGHAVLVALVRACAGRRDELHDIVKSLYNGNCFLTKYNHGLANLLKELVTALTPYPQLLVQFICWLLRERLMEQYKSAELLQCCFKTMSYEDSKVIIQFATMIIDELLFSSFGSRCLAECLLCARNVELYALERIILDRTIEIAMGQYSNYFLQRAIECGSEHLQVAIAERVAADVVNLSTHRFGSYVVEACFLLARTAVPLQRLLAAFLCLRGDELAELVRGSYSNYVVSKMLDAGKNHFPKETRALARLIDKLPASVHREMHARGVMMVVNKLIHKHHRVHATLNY